ncbi:2'-5' RNA ligase family protein [Halopelagius fulvigenes]|uniref:2'-5' RNA ligase family protein n=1 Tax=Halopelagius fulvigenes TaxID=1198324 RepID=A0ABD5U7J7_9EURY
MFSLNVLAPGSVERLAEDLFPLLSPFERVRERHTLVVKRLEGEDSLPHVRERLRDALAGRPPFDARTDGIDFFERPTRGEGPVVYLRIESSGLYDLHYDLCREFGVVEEMEGDDYTPHVTLARGGRIADAEALAAREIDDVRWTVNELAVWDARYREAAARLPLRR